MKRLCLDTVIIQTDGEPAIVEVADAVAKLRPKTLTRKTPAHSSQSNGAVESCVGHLAGQVRTMRSQIEVMHDVVISPNWCVWSWMARHAAWLASRFSVRASGRTAHEEAFDSEWKGDLCIFGESVMFREAASYTALARWSATVDGRRPTSSGIAVFTWDGQSRPTSTSSAARRASTRRGTCDDSPPTSGGIQTASGRWLECRGQLSG